jgi:hypothetical protein
MMDMDNRNLKSQRLAGGKGPIHMRHFKLIALALALSALTGCGHNLCCGNGGGGLFGWLTANRWCTNNCCESPCCSPCYSPCCDPCIGCNGNGTVIAGRAILAAPAVTPAPAPIAVPPPGAVTVPAPTNGLAKPMPYVPNGK